MSVSKPTSYLNWVPSANPSYIIQPTVGQSTTGWTAGEPPPCEYMNWLFWDIDQWIQWFDQNTSSEVSLLQLIPLIRFIGGGNIAWNLTTQTLAWSSLFNLRIPSIADSSNQAASGSVTLNDGDCAYVQANIPFTTTGDTSTSVTPNIITNLAEDNSVVIGMSVTGPGIPGGTTVLGVAGNQVTISANATSNNTGANYTFFGTGALTVLTSSSATLIPGPNTVVIATRTGTVVHFGVNADYFVISDFETTSLVSKGFVLVKAGIAGETLAQGDVVYISSGAGDGGRTLGQVYKCDAGAVNGATRNAFVGIIITGATVGNTIKYVTSGRYAEYSTLSIGAQMYVDPATPGALTATKPSTSGQYVIPVGVADSNAELLINAAIGSVSYPVAAVSASAVTASNTNHIFVVGTDVQTQLDQLDTAIASIYNIQNLGLLVTASAGDLTVAIKQADGLTDPAAGTGRVFIAFRDPTNANGSFTLDFFNTAFSVTIPNGATLGQAASVNQYIWVYAINDGGVIDIGFSGVQYFDDSFTQFTSLLSNTSTNGYTLYSGSTHVGNLPIKLIGRILVNNAVPGTYGAPADIELKPVVTINMTDWVSFTPTFSGYGTPSGVTGSSRRVGQSLECFIKFTTGTTGVTNAIRIGYNGVTGGINIDTAICGATQLVGNVSTDIFNIHNYSWTVLSPSSNNNFVAIGAQSDSIAGTTLTDAGTLFNPGTLIQMKFSVPIVGWSTYGP